MFALEISALHKHYGSHRALDGVDLRVRQGEVYGLLGPNGAGKTTLMKTVLGLQRPTSGEIRLFGRPSERRLLTEVGALVEAPGLWPHLNAQEHLRIHAKLRGVSEDWIGAVLDQVQLTGVRDRRVSQYSLGMRWRLGIAIALLVRPRFIVLDEPTNGLDPIGIREMRALIRSLSGAGVTIMISSHQLSEIAQICDRVGVLVAGRTRYEGEVRGLALDGDLEAGFFRIIESVGGGVR
ncbi:ATP-binding cassette domain-containing protein [Amycolatopsis sp. NPDC004169]|uniref:ABC transporter ATP-binding protein n=1 Tax=Amycolatopsis sp. NPDC004169 TaxID=3154453 RepID=UPI00339ED991